MKDKNPHFIYNKEGDVKVRDEKGNEKYIGEHLAENRQLLINCGLEIVPRPHFVTGEEVADSHIKADNDTEEFVNAFQESDVPEEKKTKKGKNQNK